MYLETGDLSTAEYLYDLRWMRASSEMHSATAFSADKKLCVSLGEAREGTLWVLTSADFRHDESLFDSVEMSTMYGYGIQTLNAPLRQLERTGRGFSPL